MGNTRMKRTVLILSILCSIYLFHGCAFWLQTGEEKTPRELALEGRERLNRKDYRGALESFQKLKDWYPFSKYAILAELKIGDAHYFRKEYEDAILAYEEFENLHPRNEAIPYVIYQIGMCYFKRLRSIDRDQTMAQNALKVFQKLIRKYPDTIYARKAQNHINICIKNLAEHEFYVGVFYYKSKHYKAALERFKTVVCEYPDTGVHHKALRYIALCKLKLNSNQ